MLSALLDYIAGSPNQEDATRQEDGRQMHRRRRTSSSRKLPQLPEEVMSQYLPNLTFHRRSRSFVTRKQNSSLDEELVGIVICDDHSPYRLIEHNARYSTGNDSHAKLMDGRLYRKTLNQSQANGLDRSLLPSRQMFFDRDSNYIDFVSDMASLFFDVGPDLPFVKEEARKRDKSFDATLSNSDILPGNLPPEVAVDLFVTFLTDMANLLSTNQDPETFYFGPEQEDEPDHLRSIRYFRIRLNYYTRVSYAETNVRFYAIPKPEWSLFEIWSVKSSS